MTVEKVFNHPWTRKHDDPRSPFLGAAACIAYPQSLPELIELCRNPVGTARFRAAGSHWSLSEAALSDDTFIETHDPRHRYPAMGRTLTNVIPRCLTPEFIRHLVSEGTYAVHVEAGKRIYQLYAELDQRVDSTVPGTLAHRVSVESDGADFGGPWALPTLGGAGGQTIVGALTTGTHGGDFDRPPIADGVLAIHLVADGGRHYWIEDPTIVEDGTMVDDLKLRRLFRSAEFGGPANFEIIRDWHVFNSVLVSVGRFGVIYSVVLKAVPQYGLKEQRRLGIWQDIKHQIKARGGPLYTETAQGAGVVGGQRFLQIAVCLTPHSLPAQGVFAKNLVGITKRWTSTLAAAPPGRAERVGGIVDAFDPQIGAPRFRNAGAAFPYSPDPDDPGHGDTPSLLYRACADTNFLRGVIKAVADEVEEFVESNGAVVGPTIAAVAASVGGLGLLALLAVLLVVVLLLRELLDDWDDDHRLGEQMERVKNRLLNPDPPDPARVAAGVFVWQLIAYQVFQAEQAPRDYEAISYAVMDQKNYLDHSCEVNVDSIEVFFDATDDRLLAFVDGLIAFERAQEYQSKAFVGYASLRFMGRTRAYLGMQKYATTCSVEVACLKDVSGSQELIDYAVALARNPNINAILHWGQRNDWSRDEVERVYGDSPVQPGGWLGLWRQSLAYLTNDGQRDGFSSEFTRRTGLEVS